MQIKPTVIIYKRSVRVDRLAMTWVYLLHWLVRELELFTPVLLDDRCTLPITDRIYLEEGDSIWRVSRKFPKLLNQY